MPADPPEPGAPLRIVFAGTPWFAEQHLRALLASHHDIVAVYTQPDRPARRGRKVLPSPVKTASITAGIPILQPASLKGADACTDLAALDPDVLVVVAYGLILPEAILAVPRFGCLNVHASLLPRWRGAAPVERAIEAGDAKTGITIMQMDAGLDTGNMLATATCPIADDDTGDRLREKLAALGAPLLIEVLDQIASAGSRLTGTPQNDALATYASKLQRDEAAIDWHEPAAVIDRRIRAFCSANVVTASYGGETIRVWGCSVNFGGDGAAPGEIVAVNHDGVVVACGDGALTLTRLQLPGGKVLDVRDILNGRRDWLVTGRRFQ